MNYSQNNTVRENTIGAEVVRIKLVAGFAFEIIM